MRLYQDGVWDETIINIGIKKLLFCLQENFLNEYEVWLIKKHQSCSTHFATKNSILEYLSEYFRFLAALDLYPFVKGKRNWQLEIEDSDADLEEIYMKIYKKVESNMTKSECKDIQRQLFDIIKGNSKRSTDELNKKIIELIHMDTSFKSSVFKPNTTGRLAYLDEIIAEDSD